jgi:hypothetical protein
MPGDGIAREVITCDISRHLGPDALVRPGLGTGGYAGQSGYWITAYRALSSQMIQDLKLDSQRWQQERSRPEAGRSGRTNPFGESNIARSLPYQDSRTHAARQHWGPTKPRLAHEEAQSGSSYSLNSGNQSAGVSVGYASSSTTAPGYYFASDGRRKHYASYKFYKTNRFSRVSFESSTPEAGWCLYWLHALIHTSAGLLHRF